jgi:hypothetical protein
MPLPSDEFIQFWLSRIELVATIESPSLFCPITCGKGLFGHLIFIFLGLYLPSGPISLNELVLSLSIQSHHR